MERRRGQEMCSIVLIKAVISSAIFMGEHGVSGFY